MAGGTRGPGRAPRRPAAQRRPGARPATAARSTPPARRTKGPVFTTRAVVLLVMVLLLLASYTSSLHAWWDQRGEIQDLKAENAMRKNQIEQLTDTKARWDDPAYVRQQARERFGWVMPGETGYRVIGADGTVEGDAPRLAEPPSPGQTPWYDKLWSSVEESGKRESATDPGQERPRADPDAVLRDR